MIYDSIMAELEARHVYKAEIYAPYYICSFAMHVFNLMNQRRQIYWEARRLPNMRLHNLFVAPPGYMKTFYLGQMGGDDFGVYRNCGVDIGKEQSMTEAGFIGTIISMNGCAIPTEGAAATYKNGLLLVDEFSAITNAMKVQYNSQLDSQLLAALDHGEVFKRLAGGRIEYKTHLTLWAGVQPAKYDLTSGMGRRIIFLLFLPTKHDNEALLNTMHTTRNLKPNVIEMQTLWDKINQWRKSVNQIERIEYDDSVLRMYKELKLFSYESSYFDRLLLGYYLAVNDPDKVITITMKDKRLRELVEREKAWRDSIALGIDYVQLLKIIDAYGGQIDRKILTEEALMIGWSAAQVYSLLDEMRRYGIVKLEGAVVSRQ